MPISEFNCKEHGKFEHLFISDDIAGDFYPCPVCDQLAEWAPSLCAMQPDTMWAGQNTNQGYFTSKSEYNKVLKEKNLETLTSHSELEDVRKNVAKAKAAKKEKQLKNLEKHLTNELKDVTIDPDNNHIISEREKYVRSRNKSTE